MSSGLTRGAALCRRRCKVRTNHCHVSAAMCLVYNGGLYKLHVLFEAYLDYYNYIYLDLIIMDTENY